MGGVKEGGAGALGHIFDAIFGAAVLMVGIDAAESEGLTGC
jgi:hypothetical protein